MGLYPKIQAYDGGMEVVDVFRGLNHAEKVSEGEWSDDFNLTADRFPMLSVRKKRTEIEMIYGFFVDMIAKDDLYVLSTSNYETFTLQKGVDNRSTVATFTYTGAAGGIRLISFGAYIVITGINAWYNTADGTSGTITGMPKMDFVIECQNRLWGCYFGRKQVEENGVTVTKTVNEIYASSLGKFDEWDNYDGTSMASYAASVGTDGPWTGAISYQGKPHFFKENHVHKVYISATGAHQIVDNPLLGVQEKCSRSLCEMDGALYYMSRDGVCVYDGSTPRVISDDIEDYFPCLAASFGAARSKLYVNILPIGHEPFSVNDSTMLCYDVKRGLWHRESILQHPLAAFCTYKESLFACEAYIEDSPLSSGDQASIYDMLGMVGDEPDGETSYSCTSGLIGWQNIEQKYISRFDLRLTLPQNATMKVELEYDSSGTWIEQGTVTGGGTGSVVIPVRPRRCDHFRLRLSGTGEMRMYSWAKRLTKGSDVVL